MGKKKAGGGAGLGRALMKERLQAGRGNKRGDSWVRLDFSSIYSCQVEEQHINDIFLSIMKVFSLISSYIPANLMMVTTGVV